MRRKVPNFSLPLLLLLISGGCAPQVVQRLPMNKVGRYVRSITLDSLQTGVHWGILAVNLRTGKTLVEYNADQYFTPASNTKLYTTAAALKLLGPDFRYTTYVATTGPIKDQTLNGDLVVLGSGDPTWAPRMYEDEDEEEDADALDLFRTWADSLHAAGIDKIAGDVIGVDAVFDGQPFGPSWMWDNEPYWFAAPISGLSYEENVIDITVIPRPGEKPVLLPVPQTSYVTYINDLTTLDTLNNPDSLEVDWDLWRNRGTNTVRLSGISRPDTFETAVTIENPPAFTATVLKETLEEMGIAVSGKARGIDLYGGEPVEMPQVTDTLFSYDSPTLAEIVYFLLKDSQNFMAEVLLKTVAMKPGEGATTQNGSEMIRPVLAAMGVDTNSIYLEDGSGLSYKNKVTPRNTVALLTAKQHDDIYINSLPIAGVDGTLEKMMTDSPATGHVFAKTGTLSQSRALSGYLIQTSGDTLAFSIMANAFLAPLSEVNKHISRLCELLVTL